MTNKKDLIKTRARLIFVVAMFVLPPVLAWMFYAGWIGDGYEPGQGKNYGELIHPARPLQDIQLLDSDGKAVTRDNFLALWSMLQIVDAGCDDSCLANVYNMRQIRLAMAQNAYRVQRVVLTEDLSGLTAIMAENPGMQWFEITQDSKSMLSRFPGYTDGGISAISGRIYIVDPQGNLMMQYPDDADPSKILKDLRQLLKASWIRPRDKV